MESLYIYGFAAAAGALFKLLLLAQSITSSRNTLAFNLLAVCLILQNVFEALVFFYYPGSMPLVNFAAAGVIFSMALLSSSVVSFCVVITERERPLRLQIPFWGLGVLVASLTVSGLVVTGAEMSSFLIVTIQGPFYALFQLLIVSAIVVSTWLLMKGRRSESNEISIRSNAALIAMLPIFALGLTVTISRIAGMSFSSGVLMPIASTWFAWILLKSQGDIITLKLNWRRFWFHIRQALRSARGLDTLTLQEYSEESISLQITEAMAASNNISDAARLLGWPRETVSRKWRKLCKEEPEKMNSGSSALNESI